MIIELGKAVGEPAYMPFAMSSFQYPITTAAAVISVAGSEVSHGRYEDV